MSDRSTAAILQAIKLIKIFREGPQEVTVLKKIDFRLEAGARIAIIGASGSGKSTLLHCLGGLDTPSSGQIFWQGQDLAKLNETKLSQLRNQHLGFVYQFHHLLPEFSALENVALPLLIGGVNPKIAQERAEELLKRVGLGERLQHKPSELSGGERQRAAVARALSTEPAGILADEPTGNLDRATALGIHELLLQLNQEHKISLLIVTHDPELAGRMDQIWRLEDGGLKLVNA